MKYYELKAHNEVYKVALFRKKYYYTDSLAVNLICDDGEPFGTCTVNIDEPFSSCDDESLAFVDVNNLDYIEKFLTDNKIAEPTGYRVTSGYCEYPEYKFDLSKLN